MFDGRKVGIKIVKPIRDLTGQTFNMLTVLRQAEDKVYGDGRHYSAWWCKCGCGNPNEVYATGYDLVSGHKKSCGCLVHNHFKSNNTYDLSGLYGICTMADGNKFLFDKEDYDLISKYVWHLSGREYIGTTIVNVGKNGIKRQTLMLHRLIMGIQNIDWKELVVDHINGDVYDNRKENLRVVPQMLNSKNQKLSKNNTSGATGVHLRKNGKWDATIRSDGKYIFLGLFDSFDDALAARRAAEEKYFGEYSYENSRGVKREGGTNDI